MTRYIFARVFIASLVFLGDLALATESRSRVETEAVASDITAQVSKQTIPDDSESSVEPAAMGSGITLPVIFRINQKLPSIAWIAPGEHKYLSSYPRAPPQTASS